MENYVKSGEKEVECRLPFDVSEDVKIMNIKTGTKQRNILTYVEKEMQNPQVRQIVFRGFGEATAKCISCVEVFKRSYKDGTLYQKNDVAFSRRSDIWTPNKAELSTLLVHVDTPSIFILLSKDPFPNDVLSESCQTSNDEVTGFMPKDKIRTRQSGRRYQKNAPSGDSNDKPKLKRPSDPNKWKRPPKKQNGNGSQQNPGSSRKMNIQSTSQMSS
ncbi:hypothetical protein AB6A40_008248 [Gnathostoma spinigerum]|uniref:DNA/RNA-binding protein Alba-like domain-containing protein n=1 Tax=Gnathostoma spinigerum TaxID=75299 RepID=A0ABD6ENI2_9BILA